MNRDAALSAYLAEKGRELEYRKSVIEKEKAAKQTESLKEVSKREYEHENGEETTAVKKLCLRNSDDIKEEVSTSDSEFCSNQTEGSIQNGNTRKPSSCQNVWDGVALVTNTCFDSFTGALLSKEKCKASLENSMKSKKEFDWYQPLQLASQPGVAFTPMADALKLCSLMLLQVNKIQKRNQPKPPELVEEKKPANVFDINIARQADTECYLPGGQKVFITNFIGPSLISKWVGKTIENALESAILDLIEVLREKDPSWLLYSAADSSRTKYLRIEDNFFETFGRVLIAGFGLTAESLSETIANIRTKISSQIDRKREKRNPDLKQNLETFRNLLANDPWFRIEEPCL